MLFRRPRVRDGPCTFLGPPQPFLYIRWMYYSSKRHHLLPTFILTFSFLISNSLLTFHRIMQILCVSFISTLTLTLLMSAQTTAAAPVLFVPSAAVNLAQSAAIPTQDLTPTAASQSSCPPPYILSGTLCLDCTADTDQKITCNLVDFD